MSISTEAPNIAKHSSLSLRPRGSLIQNWALGVAMACESPTAVHVQPTITCAVEQLPRALKRRNSLDPSISAQTAYTKRPRLALLPLDVNIMSPQKPRDSYKDEDDAVVILDNDRTPRQLRSFRKMVASPAPAFGPLSLKAPIVDDGFSIEQPLKLSMRPLDLTALKPSRPDSHYSDDLKT